MTTRLASLSIKTQILLLAFIVAIPAAGIIVYSGIQMREGAINVARMEAQRLVDTIESEQRNLTAAAQQLMIALAQLPDVKKQDTAAVEPVLKDILSLNEQYSNIFMVDRDGRTWATAMPAQSSIRVSDRRYFLNAAASGHLSSGEFVFSKFTGKPAIAIAYPQKDARGTFNGLIGIGFHLDYYQRLLERTELLPGTGYALLDHAGVLLVGSADHAASIGTLDDAGIFKRMQDGPDEDVFIGTGADGKERIISYGKLRLPREKTPYMYVRAELLLDVVSSNANRTLFTNLSLLTSFFAMAFLIAWIIGKRSIADRVTMLEDATRKLANGDLSVKVSDLVAGGELGRLGQTFDAMARQLSLREQALAESERNYRDIFNSTRDAVFVHDAASGAIIEVNKTAEELYGYSREEVLHRSVQHLSSGELPYAEREALAWIRKALAEGPQAFTWQARKKSGELFWTEVVLSATHGGGAQRVLAVVRDITDRKRADEARRESEERLHAAVGVSQIGIFDHDQQADTIYWSPQQREIHGWGPDEPVSLQAFLDLIHPEDRESVTAAVRHAHDPAGDGIWDVEHRIIRRDGSVRWLKERSQTFFEGAGAARRPVRTIGAVLDITERKQAEDALRENEERLRLALTAANQGLYDLSLRTGEAAVSPEYATMLGYDPADFRETNARWIERLHPDDHDRVAEVYRAYVRGEIPAYEVEFRQRTRSGDWKWVLSLGKIVARDAEGNPLRMLGTHTDITERKRAEQALLEIKELFSLFLRHSPIYTYIKEVSSTESRVLQASENFHEMIGIPGSAMAGKSMAELFPPDFAAKITADDWTIVSGGDVLRIEEELNGRTYTTIKFPLVQGERTLLAGYTIDITERKRADAALRESRNLLQTVLDTIPARVFWKDLDLRYLGCNQPFALDAGLHSPEEMIGKDDYQMGWREQADLYRSDDRHVLGSGKPKLNYEEPQTTPDGRRIWLRTNKVPLKNADGTIRGVLGTYEDITEYKQAEASLRQAALIVENSPVMLFRWKAAEGWPMVLVSQNVVQLGYTPEELLGGSVMFASIVHPEDLERIGREVQTYTASGADRFQQEYRLVTRDGHVRWIDDRTMVERDDTGRVTHYQGIVVDITERKQAEAERERLIGELELRNAELERFTYTVSHDLKSPLITMRGFLGYLEKDALAGNTERIRADIGRITDATDKMDRLLRELLELSRIGRAMNPPEQVPFEEVAREAVGLVAGRLQERAIRLEIATGMPVVSGDRVRLVEVVQNLVDNAAKFMGSQPAPLIEIGVRGEERNGKPVFFVRDNGIGIEPQYQDKIFGLFDKLDPKTEGTGIGLALVKRIIEVHGGTIWLESGGSGGGATFCFTLPRAKTPTRNGEQV